MEGEEEQKKKVRVGQQNETRDIKANVQTVARH